MICYLVYPSILLVIWNPKIVFQYDKPVWSGLPFVATITEIIHLLRIQRSASRSTARATPASAAASASASPASRRRRGGPGRLEPDIRVRYRGRRPKNRVKRDRRRRPRDAVESSVVSPGIRSRFSCACHRPPHQQRRRGNHHGGGASPRAPSSTRIPASTSPLRS